MTGAKPGKWPGWIEPSLVYLARPEDGHLTYAGKVERGFDERLVAELKERVSTTRKQPFEGRIAKPKATWVRPEIPVDVEY